MRTLRKPAIILPNLQRGHHHSVWGGAKKIITSIAHNTRRWIPTLDRCRPREGCISRRGNPGTLKGGYGLVHDGPQQTSRRFTKLPIAKVLMNELPRKASYANGTSVNTVNTVGTSLLFSHSKNKKRQQRVEYPLGGRKQSEQKDSQSMLAPESEPSRRGQRWGGTEANFKARRRTERQRATGSLRGEGWPSMKRNTNRAIKSPWVREISPWLRNNHPDEEKSIDGKKLNRARRETEG